jgi:type IV pilus assembly protein PilW
MANIPNHRQYHNDKGFTLVELMVALTAALLLVGGTMFVAQYATQSYRAQERISDAQQNLRSAMDMMVRDIRMAGYDPMSSSVGRNPGINLLTAQPNELRFTLDRNNSGLVDVSSQEDITYLLQGNEIRRFTDRNTPQQSNELFIDGVTAFTCVYLDSDGNATATISRVAMIDITIAVQDRNSEGGFFNRVLNTRINCRNLRI